MGNQNGSQEETMNPKRDIQNFYKGFCEYEHYKHYDNPGKGRIKNLKLRHLLNSSA